MNFHTKILTVAIMGTILLVSRSVGSPLVESSNQLIKDSNTIEKNESSQVPASNFEKQETQILELEREVEDIQRASGLVPSDSCGGYVLIPNQAVLSFKDSRPNTADPPTLQKCVWIVWAADSGPIRYTLMDHNFGLNPQSVNSTNSSALRFQTDLNRPSPSQSHFISAKDEGVEQMMEVSCGVLVFSSYPGQSFSLRLRGQGTIEAHKFLKDNSVFLNPEVGKPKTYAYPPIDSGANYTQLEIRITVLQALAGQKIQVSLDYLDTEEAYDALTFQEFSSSQDKFLYLQRFSGQVGRLQDVNFLANENEPILVFFVSDSTVEGRGFRISYSYIPA